MRMMAEQVSKTRTMRVRRRGGVGGRVGAGIQSIVAGGRGVGCEVRPRIARYGVLSTEYEVRKRRRVVGVAPENEIDFPHLRFGLVYAHSGS
jgi:hypothetical protein